MITEFEPETESRELTLSLRRRAMDYLARREHSRFEVFSKLSEKFPEVDSALIESVLDKLEADKLLSDERFVESYVRGRVSRGYGPLYIRYQLRQRRVSSELIEAALGHDETFWLESLGDVISRKFGGGPLPPKGSAMWLKMQRFIQSRGFAVQHMLHISQAD